MAGVCAPVVVVAMVVSYNGCKGKHIQCRSACVCVGCLQLVCRLKMEGQGEQGEQGLCDITGRSFVRLLTVEGVVGSWWHPEVMREGGVARVVLVGRHVSTVVWCGEVGDRY
jgi:hypothetical protein